MKKLILVGAGGHCKSCIDIVEKTGEYNIVGLIDLKEKIGEPYPLEVYMPYMEPAVKERVSALYREKTGRDPDEPSRT